MSDAEGHDRGRRRPTSTAEGLAAYVSPLLLERLADGSPIAPPEARHVDTAVALLDVEGFSAMVEAVSASGSRHLERLATQVNDFFGRLVGTIEQWGGLAHCFPGDAVIAVWPAGGVGLAEATRRAVACAQTLVTASAGGAASLPLKAGVGAGRAMLAHVGHAEGRRDFLLAGPALADMGRAEGHAEAGRVVVAGDAWNLIADRAAARWQADGVVMLESISPGACPDPRAAAASALPAGALALLRRYVPASLLRQIDADQADWLGEFRQLSVVFIRIIPARAEDTLDVAAIDRCYREVERVVTAHGGTVMRFAHDDKGLGVLAALGVPPWTHEDDAHRAVRAGLAARASLRAMGAECSVGIASGRVYCGPLGARARREYSIVGSVANLAARLATAAEPAVLCDRATASRVGAGLRLDPVAPAALPARIHGETFRAGGSGETVASSDTAPGDDRPAAIAGLVGRQHESERAAAWLAGLTRRDGDRILVLRGEAGIGKSTLLDDLLARARAAGMPVLEGASDALAAYTAYHPWRAPLLALLDVDTTSPEAPERIADAVRGFSGDDAFAPLLAAVVGVSMEDTVVTRALAGTIRRDNTLALVTRLLQRGAAGADGRPAPLVVAIEDAHWMDSASWALVDTLRRMGGDAPAAVVLTMRPEIERDAHDVDALLARPGIALLDLQPLTAEATALLIERQIGAAHAATEVAQYVFRQSQGNPLFAEELLASLRESGQLEVAERVARLRVGGGHATDELVSTSVRGVLTGRIDRLDAAAQLTLKAASVAGQQFDLATLSAIHPKRESREVVRAQLDELVAVHLIRAVDAAAGDRFAFRHAITRDVAYGLMLHEQRRRLHQALAEYLERGGAGATTARLLHHWREAGEPPKAMRYVDDAAQETMRQGGYREAIELLQYGLAADAESEPAAPDAGTLPRAARWRSQLAEAQVALGLHGDARDNLEAFLTRIGASPPSRPAALIMALWREIMRQALARARRRDLTVGPTSGTWSAASAAYEQLGYIHYATGEMLLGTHAALRMMNLAERARDLAIQARAYAAISLTASVGSLTRLGDAYERRAIAAARRVESPLVLAHVEWVAAVRAAGEGRWDRVESGATGAIGPCERLGDHRLHLMALQTRASGEFFRGDLARAQETGQRQLALAREQGNALWEAWALTTLAEVALARGEPADTITHCERALALLQEESDAGDRIRASGLLALAMLEDGRPDEALALARATAAVMETAQLTAFSAFEGYAETAEVALRLAERIVDAGRRPAELHGLTASACRSLRRFARVFPIARPRAALARARQLVLASRPDRAARHWRRAIDHADRLGMPREAALARHAPAGGRTPPPGGTR